MTARTVQTVSKTCRCGTVFEKKYWQSAQSWNNAVLCPACVADLVKCDTAIVEAVTAQGWRDLAVCRSPLINPETFWPVATVGAVYERQVAEAREICSSCQVWVECLTEAVERGEDGIWAGMTPEERRALRRRTA